MLKAELFDERSSDVLFKNLENLVWLSCVEAAVYLRKFRRKDGKPSVGAIWNLIYRGKLKARKFGKCVYLKRSEIDRAIELSIL